MTDYMVVFEPASDGSWSAYVPDLPGVVAAGADRAEAESHIREAISIHREELERLGETPDLPRSLSAVVSV